MKKLFYLGALLMMAGSFSMNAQYTFSGGSGTKADPYQIKTAEDLAAVGNYTQNSDVAFIMMNDIDLADYIAAQQDGWPMIGGGKDSAFRGVFDGNSHVITGFTMLKGTQNSGGLFGCIGAPGVVKNLTIKDAEIECGAWAGILTQKNGNWEDQGGSIDNVHIIGGSIMGTSQIGGLAGLNNGDVTNCSVVGTYVEATGNQVGGLFGLSETLKSFKVTDNFVYAEVKGGENVGGIIGFQGTGFPTVIENNAAYGQVTASVKYAGGIVGYLQGGDKTTSIVNNYSHATVNGLEIGGIGGAPIDASIVSSYVTGNVNGGNADASVWNVGGIVSQCYGSVISGCYFAGTATGGGKVGAIESRAWAAVKNCYWDKTKTKNAIGEGGGSIEATGLETADMMSFDKMKFTDAARWKIIEGKSLPYFANQTAPITVTEMTTTGAKGTYTGTLDQLVFYTTSYYGAAYEPTSVNIADGKWEVKWNGDEIGVLKDDVVAVFGKAKDLMPSQAVEARVTEGGSGVASASVAGKARVATGDGYIRILSDNLAAQAYSLVNLAGATVKAGTTTGITTEIATSGLASGVYVLTVDGTQAFKVLVK